MKACTTEQLQSNLHLIFRFIFLDEYLACLPEEAKILLLHEKDRPFITVVNLPISDFYNILTKERS